MILARLRKMEQITNSVDLSKVSIVFLHMYKEKEFSF